MGQHRSLGVNMTIAVRARSLTLRSSSLTQGRRMGLLKSATRSVGWAFSPSGGGGIEIGMRLIESDWSGSRRRLQEILANRAHSVRHTGNPAGAAVRGEVRHRGAFLTHRRPNQHYRRECTCDQAL